MERQTITVDIAPGNSQVERLGSSQGDIGRPMGVYIIQNGVALDCSAYSAELYILKPDGKFYTTQATVDATEKNLIKWETALQETPVAGACAAQIRIAAGDDDIGTARFVEFVEASPGDMGSASESEVLLLTEYVRQARESATSAGRDATTASGAASSASGSASTATTAANTATQAATAATAAADRAEAVEESIPADYSQMSADVTELKSAINSVEDLLPTVKIDYQNYIEINGTGEELSIKLNFTAQSGNRVYCGGKNLFDGTIRNIALGASTVIASNTYRGFYVPVKGGLTYTISRSSKSSGRFRIGETADVPEAGVALLGQPYVTDDNALALTITSKAECKYLVVYLSNSSEDVSGTNFQCEIGSSATSFAAYDGELRTTSNATETMETADGKTIAWCDSGDIAAEYSVKAETTEQMPVVNTNTSNTGNFSIVCAKERSYTDGTPPVIECFLLEEVGTKKFYFSQDLIEKTYAFTFNGDSHKYAFGVLQNGDVIACILADALESGKDDAHRQNPYAWLASEKWQTRHEVVFSGRIPPCGWLENCGFKVLADGSAIFTEYTRMTVATSNVWKISGNPTDASNWSIKKSFTITTNDNMTGFKHIHMVMQDFYNGTIYISTGDDDDNSMIFYSTDGGTTWMQLGTSSQKYCRNLNFIFTKDYIYWVPDTTATSARYLFRASRDANGILDFASKEDYIAIGAYPTTGSAYVAAYGGAYIPELNAIFVLDRSDGVIASIPLKLCLLDSAEVKTIGTLEAASGTMLVGFRTRFSEWYPHDGLMHFGFGLRRVGDFECTNKNKGFGNHGLSTTGAGANNINNLIIKVYKNGDDYGFTMDTKY